MPWLIWLFLAVATASTLQLAIDMRRFSLRERARPVGTRAAWTELILMSVRWLAVAIVIIATVNRYVPPQRRLSATITWTIGLLFIHIVLGFLSLLFWNAWLSGAIAKTPLQSKALAIAYLALSSMVIVLLVCLQL
jgi:hypothetical protein